MSLPSWGCSGACGSPGGLGPATWVSAPLWLRWPLVLADLQRCDWVSVGIFGQLPCCLLLPLKPRSGGSSSSIVQDDKRKRRFKRSRFNGTRDCSSRSKRSIVQIVSERFDHLERLTSLEFLMSLTTRPRHRSSLY